MKVALCFLISYQHILNKEQLWIDWITPNQDIINVYFHYKNIKKIKSPWIKIHTIDPAFVQNTTYIHVVPAYIAVLTYAYEHDKQNKWFCMLTDSCVPIISPAQFRHRFTQFYASSIIRCVPAHWNVDLHHRANLRMLSLEFRLANDPWFTLCRDHVHKCILFLTYKTSLYKQINQGGLANESMFAIILQTFGELTNQPPQRQPQPQPQPPQRHINSSSHICDWTRMSSPTSPYVFQEASEVNIQRIRQLLEENKYSMFLRKVHPDFPDAVLLQIQQEQEQEHEKKQKDNKKKRGNECTLLIIGLLVFMIGANLVGLLEGNVF